MISLVLVRALVVAAKDLRIVGDESEFEAWLEDDSADPADAIARARFDEVLRTLAARARDDSAAAARLGARVGTSQLHFFGPLWMSSVTLQQAVQRLLSVRRSVLGGPAWRLVQDGPTTLLGCSASSAPNAWLEAQFMTALVHRLVADYLGPSRSDVLEVHFAFAQPPDVDALRQEIPCSVYFDSPLNGVAIPTELMARRRPGSDEGLSLELEKFVHERFLVGRTPSWAGRVRQMLLVADRPGSVELESLAVSWGVSARSVRRRLEEEGVRYQELREDVCMALAGEWLRRRQDHSSEIARLLGREVTSFRRAFKRHFGTTPTGYRRGDAPSSSAFRPEERS